MKISKIRIKNLFGLSEVELDGKDREFAGDNAVGKTSVIDAIRVALTNRNPREYLIKTGAEEGEVYIETDTGLMIKRLFRTKKTDYARIKQDGEKGAAAVKTEAFLREFFTELQLDPVAFLSMSPQDQNRMILDLIDFPWDLEWIKEQFGEIPPDIRWDQNILAVLHDIQKEGSFYYEKRQELNREIKSNHANVEEIGKDLPKEYNASYWRQFDIGELYAQLERIRNTNQQITTAKSLIQNKYNKLRLIDGDMWAELNALQAAHDTDVANAQDRIRKMEEEIRGLKTKIAHWEQGLATKQEAVRNKFRADRAQYEAEVEQYVPLSKQDPVDTTELQQQVDTVLKMREHGNEYDRMVRLQAANATLMKQVEALTAKIEKARMLPGEILAKSSIPVKGITISNGIPLINGLPISNLSEGEKLELCIDVAASKPQGLQIILIDGVEKLSGHNRQKLYERLKARGIQFMATRTTDSPDLTVIEL